MSAKLWDEYGRPLQPHTGNTVCPKCGEDDEVGSSFDDAWCCHCGWHGSIFEASRHTRMPIALARGQAFACEYCGEGSDEPNPDECSNCGGGGASIVLHPDRELRAAR